MKNRISLLGLMLLVGSMLGQSVPAQTIPIYSLAKAPTVDGDDKDWGTLPVTTVALKKTKHDSTVGVKRVAVKAGTNGNRVYIFLEWDDPTKDDIHKPWVWDEGSKKYKLGPQREDRLAVHFAMRGNYTTDWRSGNEIRADTWHWKASRSNPLGLAHDKSLVISSNKLLRAYKLELPAGKSIYISRPSDGGSKLYKTKRYRRFEQNLMPKYVLTVSPKGSVADVSARGIWSDGRWRLELSRKMETGNGDDVAFPLDQGKVLGGIAVFDHSENNDHAISDTLTFEFLNRPWHAN